MGYISYQELLKNAKLLAIANNTQIQKKGKSNKSPAINWEKNPDNYNGIKDDKYGTAIICDYIPELDLYLSIIDFDKPKTDEDIPLSVLRSVSMKMIENTYSVDTPSGGLHIYLLSKKQPIKPPKLLNNLNIDFQANYGKGRGKYVVANYRWDTNGKFKEHYIKRPESPSKIKIINNANDILNALIEDLEKYGHIKNEAQKLILDIVSILKPYAKTTKVHSRQYFSCGIAGYFKKQGYPQETVEEIVREVFSEDEEIEQRVNNVQRTYEKDNKDIKGWSVLKEYILPTDQEELLKLTRTNHDNIKTEITQKLSKHKEPSTKLLFDYISMHLDLYINLDTLKYYEKTKEGSFVEIDEKRLISFFIDEFGTVSISREKCTKLLKHIINPITKDYDLIEFNNGFLNTRTREFTEDKQSINRIPKEKLDLNWDSTAEGGEIEQIISDILDNPRYPNNKDIWLRAVGHAFMGWNSLQKVTIVTGPPGTGKSTLTKLLQRLFSYSSISLQDITHPDQFTYYSLVDKSINIDDDVQNGALIGIGKLNTIISGDGFETQVKHERQTITAINPQIPRLFANGNSLPPIIGEGWERRLLLIMADNIIPYEEKNNTLHNEILKGQHDKGLEWLVYTSITKFWDLEGKPITTPDDERRMHNRFLKKSDPILVIINELYEEDFEGESIPVNEVYYYIKKRCNKLFKVGEISRDFKKPSIRKIKDAMNRAGFDTKRLSDGMYYEDIKTSNELHFLVGET